MGGARSGWYPRSLGAVLILFAALAVSTPVLHRLSRTEEPSGTGRQATVLFCPFCGEQLGANVFGSADCSHCGQTFTIWTAGRPSTMAQRGRTERAEASKVGR